MRYAISGAIVTGFYLGAPLLLNDALGLPLQMAIPIAFVIAATLQFNLQRRFVFRHVEQFALSVRAQIVWYVTVGSIQYPVTALGTLIGPKLTGLSDRLSFLATSLTFSVVFFLFIRGRVFHASENASEDEIAASLATVPEVPFSVVRDSHQ
jgi:putative flippase GtrA